MGRGATRSMTLQSINVGAGTCSSSFLLAFSTVHSQHGRGMRFRAGFSFVVLVLAGLSVGTSHAHEPRRGGRASDRFVRPYTVAEAGVGVLTLPTTDICLTSPDTCTTGDTSAIGYAWMLYRINESFALGAGVAYAPPVGSDTPQRSPGMTREHKRQYLTIDLVGRYYLVRYAELEGWLGATVGGVAISDRYKTEAENPSAPIIGMTGASVRTEGLSAGFAAGLSWSFTENWSVEGSLRSAWWLLPSRKECASTGDCATLASDVAMFNASLGVGYRMTL